LRAGDVARLESVLDPKSVVPIEGENSLQPRGADPETMPTQQDAGARRVLG